MCLYELATTCQCVYVCVNVLLFTYQGTQGQNLFLNQLTFTIIN